MINCVDFRAHSNPLFLNHRTLKVSDIYSLQLGIFMHQFISNNLLKSFQNMFMLNSQIHSYQTRHLDDFHIPCVHSSKSINCVSFQCAKYWNSLNDNHNKCKSPFMFKKKLKNVLFRKIPWLICINQYFVLRKPTILLIQLFPIMSLYLVHIYLYSHRYMLSC